MSIAFSLMRRSKVRLRKPAVILVLVMLIIRSMQLYLVGLMQPPQLEPSNEIDQKPRPDTFSVNGSIEYGESVNTVGPQQYVLRKTNSEKLNRQPARMPQPNPDDPISDENTVHVEVLKRVTKEYKHGKEVLRPVRAPKGTATMQIHPCPVTCHVHGVFSGGITYMFIPRTNWTIILSMEGPVYYPILDQNKKQFSAYAVMTMNSEIPNIWLNFSALYPTKYPAVPFHGSDSRPSFIATNCRSRNNREQWVREIASVFPVASLGPCLHNTGKMKVMRNMWLEEKIKVMHNYKFHLGFENQNADQITEKLWATLEAGTIPVYLGDEHARKWAPKNSFISAHDFPNGAALGRYLKDVSENETLYNSYHAWRSLPPEPHLLEMYSEIVKYGIRCRICLWAQRKFQRGDPVDVMRMDV